MEQIAYTVSCFDPMFCSPAVNCGSYLTMDEAIAGAIQDKKRLPSTKRYRVHISPLGYYFPDYSNEVLSLLF